MIYVWATLITAAAWAARYWYDGPPWREEKACADPARPDLRRGHLPIVRSTPDSERYLAMGRGVPQSWPFHARFLLPWLCGRFYRRPEPLGRYQEGCGDVWAWHILTAGSLILSGPALAGYALAHGLSGTQALACVIAFTGLWGVCGLLTLCPVLVDAPAMLLAVAGAGLYLHTREPLLLGAIGLTVGAIKETGPVWLALFAWHPAALIGLVVPASRRWLTTYPPPDHTIIANPVKSAQMYRRGTLFDGTQMVFTWGIGLAAFLNPSPLLWTALGLAYLQPLIASDVSRLVQQVAPVVLVHAIPVIPDAWLPLALVLHLFNPFARNSLEAQPVRLVSKGSDAQI